MIMIFIIPKEIQLVLEQCTNKVGKFNGKKFKSLLTENINNFLTYYNINWRTLYYNWRNNKNFIRLCPECNGIPNYGNEFCSNKCASNSEKIKQKRINTSIKNYGVDNPSKSKIIKDKVKQTSIERFGDYYSKTDEYKERCKQTCLDHYGIEHYTQTDEFKERSKQTCLEKYGVEYYTQTDEYKERYKQTCLERYGVENLAQSDEIKEKIRNTFLSKYNVDNPAKLEFYKNKQVFTYRKNNYSKIIQKLYNKNVIIDMPIEEFCSSNVITYKCLICGNIWTTTNYHEICCQNCAKSNTSFKEKELVLYTKSIYDGLVIENDRKLLKNKELDIYIPSKNLAIEFNGIYWHSDIFKDNDYHLNKTNLCKKHNVGLIHIFESEYSLNADACKSIIYNEIHKSLNSYENCILHKISSYEYNIFIEKNWFLYETDINDTASYYGLFLNDTLLSVCKVIDYKIFVYNKLYAGNLIKYYIDFIRNNKLRLIVDISKDITDYQQYGFIEVNTLEPTKIDYNLYTVYNCGYKEFIYE